jgi:hypothetical protein
MSARRTCALGLPHVCDVLDESVTGHRQAGSRQSAIAAVRIVAAVLAGHRHARCRARNLRQPSELLQLSAAVTAECSDGRVHWRKKTCSSASKSADAMRRTPRVSHRGPQPLAALARPLGAPASEAARGRPATGCGLCGKPCSIPTSCHRELGHVLLDHLHEFVSGHLQRDDR